MCGIVGYLGTRQAFPVLMKGLKRLEYRGYDSAGVALLANKGELNVYKTKGKVADLEAYVSDKDISGTVGIAHTRWATHGEPNSTNAHPHISSSGKLAIIHNGIIENYAVLKKYLQGHGVTFRSDTDTEVLIQLVEYIKTTKGSDLLTAVRMTLRMVVGAYAIAILNSEDPNQIIVARKSSPLVIGIGQDEWFVGSDASPIIEYTDKVIYIEDNEVAVLTRGHNYKIVDIHNIQIDHDIKTIDMDLGQIEKGGFPHFMMKEIFEQPDCLSKCMSGRVNVDIDNVVLSAVIDHRDKLLSAKRFIIVACGTSWHAGLIGKQLIENFCHIPVMVEYASEFRYSNPPISSDDVVIAISQSGETADTLAAVEMAKSKGAFIYGVCNAVSSSIPRSTDTGSYIHVGPEIGVASTKAFTGQVTVLTMLALALAKEKGTIDDKEFMETVEELHAIPEKMRQILEQNPRIETIAKIFTYAHNFLYLGRGFNYPVALEGALKLKEISYIHAEGYPAAEMKHGPIALVDEKMPVLFVATHHKGYQKIISNMEEVKARGGKIIAIITDGDKEIEKIADEVIPVPKTLPQFAPLLSVIPLQLLAYHIAVQKGLNVDMPRNLAKSVTVE